MPFVQIKVIQGVFTDEKKQQLLNKVTDAVVSIEGEKLRPYTLVLIDEVKSGDWSVGGKSLSTDEVKAMAAGKNEKAA